MATSGASSTKLLSSVIMAGKCCSTIHLLLKNVCKSIIFGFCERSIPWKLTAYYAATLVLALDHIHAKGVVYRDLKPENIMVDHRGFLRVIDFGFAKKVPFTKPDSNGQMKVYNKTYTLCGTPG